MSTNDAIMAAALAEAELYGDKIGGADEPPPPITGPPAPTNKDFYPDLNPTQDLIFNDPRNFILGYGEKGSGKSIGFGHKLVRHAYENENALVLIITPSIRTGSDGIWYDLSSLILPQWRDGFGLEYTDSKLDPLTKDRHRWIRNRFGGWSKLLLISIPYAEAVENRIKGPAPSLVYIDELTNCNGKEYMQFTAAQLGRRRGIAGPQQFLASCNPDGPSHWVYKAFWQDCEDLENGVEGPDGVKRDKDYAVYHVPIQENIHRLPPGYVDRLMKVFRGDEVEMQRLIHGAWIDRPTGEGLFRTYFRPKLHVRGDAFRGQGLLPVPGFPIQVGYDLGQVYNSVTFEQIVPTRDKTLVLVFDEIDYLKTRILYKTLTLEILERMRYWRTRLGYEFKFQHIADESAVNQWRPGGEGSYDAWDIERFSQDKEGKPQIKIVGCPKGKGSVASRIQMVRLKLFQEELLVSDTCKNTKEMFLHLEEDEKGEPKRSRFIHKFDSLTYPMFKMEILTVKAAHSKANARIPTIIRIGG
jgi:hypothetical protein